MCMALFRVLCSCLVVAPRGVFKLKSPGVVGKCEEPKISHSIQFGVTARTLKSAIVDSFIMRTVYCCAIFYHTWFKHWSASLTLADREEITSCGRRWPYYLPSSHMDPIPQWKALGPSSQSRVVWGLGAGESFLFLEVHGSGRFIL